MCDAANSLVTLLGELCTPGRYQVGDYIRVLRAIEADLQNIEIQGSTLDDIAPMIHRLYQITNMSVRGCLLKIITELELASLRSIIEKYSFDALVAVSLDQRLTVDPPPKVDEEKKSAFGLIAVLLKVRRHLPMSILRAMVSLYNTPKHGYRQLIVAYFCEVFLEAPSDLVSVPEVVLILIENMKENGGELIPNLISHAIENSYDVITQKHIMSQMITPFATLGSSSDAKKNENAEKAIINLLRTWPGLIFAGFHQDIIQDLLQCLSHQTESIVNILSNLLTIEQKQSITDSYVGLLFYNLTNMKMITKLHKLSSNQEASNLLNRLMPFITHNKNDYDLIPIANHESKVLQQKSNSKTSMLSKFASSTQLSSLNNDSLQNINDNIEWSAVEKVISVILRHDSIQSSSPAAKELYVKLLEYFSTSFLKKVIKPTSDRSNCLTILVRHLLSEQIGLVILERNSKFIQAMTTIITELADESKPVKNWGFYRCIAEFLKSSTGIAFLNKNKMADPLKFISKECKDPDVAENILEYLDLSNLQSVAFEMFKNIYLSKNRNIQNLAIQSLAKFKESNHDLFTKNVFPSVVIPLIKLNQESDYLMEFLIEVFLENEECVELAASDPEIHQILQKQSHIVFCLLFGTENGLKIGNIKTEIQWWMETGNRLYVRTYDESIEKSMKTQKPIPLPPHIFCQLSKTEKGLEYAEQNLKKVIDGLLSKSNTDKRASLLALGNFASNHNSLKLIHKFHVLEDLFAFFKTTKSYVMKGTFIASISMFSQSKYLSNILEENGWFRFKFGNHSATIPVNVSDLFEQISECNNAFPSIDDIEGQENITLLLRQLSSPISQKQARTDLQEIYKTDPQKFSNPQLSHYAAELMKKFVILPDNRYFMIRIFSKSPILRANNTVVFNQEKLAEVRAKLFLLCQNSELDQPISHVKIPKYPISELKNKKICSDCPEQFVEDAEFNQKFGINKSEFYILPPSEMSEKRAALLQ